MSSKGTLFSAVNLFLLFLLNFQILLSPVHSSFPSLSVSKRPPLYLSLLLLKFALVSLSISRVKMENQVRKPDSAWRNGQVCPENSEWLAENVKGFDQSAKEMLLLIEQDGDFLVEEVHGDHPKQHELIARIKEISHKHHLLADHCNKLTGELNGHVLSANGMKNCGNATFGPELTPHFLTPDKKLGMLNIEDQAVGSDLSSGGGILETTPNRGSESSLLSSDSDSESYGSSPSERSSSIPSGKMLNHGTVSVNTQISGMEGVIGLTQQEHVYDTEKGECERYKMLLRRISDYEKELKVSNEKFQSAEEEIAKLKSELQHNEAVLVQVGSLEAQLVSAKNQVKLLEFEIEKENQGSLTLQRQIVDLEARLQSEQRHALELQESVKKYTAELSDRDLEIRKLNAELQDASGNFALEKWQLESSVSKLSERLVFHETRNKELQMQCDSVADEIKKYKAWKIEIEERQEVLKISWQDDIENMKAELCKKNMLVDTLNQTIDGLKLNYDMLMAEKDGVIAKLQAVNADLSVRDDQIKHLEHNLHELHSENKQLSVRSDSATKLAAELKSRIDELEKEAGKKAAKISDLAEEKREAIRQLCFSLDHFRSAYEEVRNACVIRRQPTTVAS